MSTFIVIMAFAAGFLVVFSVNLILADVVNRRRRHVAERLNKELRLQQREKVRSEILQHKDLARLAAEGQANLTNREVWFRRLAKWLEQSGTDIKPHTLVSLSLITGAIPAFVAFVFLRQWPTSTIIMLTGIALPPFYVAIRRKKRCEKLLAQLPDAFELMSRMLRAGQTIPQALQGVADEFSNPVSSEFGYCYEQQNLGLTAEAAMQELARRTGLLELRIFVVAVSVHRQTGGNLSELLDRLAGVIRERRRIQGHIQSLTAEGRLQAAILLGLPPFLLAVLTAVNQEYVATLLQYPYLLVGMFSFELIGALWLRAIVNFDF